MHHFSLICTITDRFYKREIGSVECIRAIGERIRFMCLSRCSPFGVLDKYVRLLLFFLNIFPIIIIISFATDIGARWACEWVREAFVLRTLFFGSICMPIECRCGWLLLLLLWFLFDSISNRSLCLLCIYARVYADCVYIERVTASMCGAAAVAAAAVCCEFRELDWIIFRGDNAVYFVLPLYLVKRWLCASQHRYVEWPHYSVLHTHPIYTNWNNLFFWFLVPHKHTHIVFEYRYTYSATATHRYNNF